MKTLHVLSLTGILAASLVADAGAQKTKRAGKPAACPGSVIPLAVGNSWTYEAVGHPNALEPNQTRMLPDQAKKVVITVDAVETKDGVTVASLTEDVDGRKIATTVTCSATALQFSPDSLLFSGEPGGTFHVEWSDVVRKGATFPLAAGKLASYEWTDDFSASWKRNATEGTQADLGKGTITLERRIVVTADEPVATTAGSWSKAAKIGVQTRGQIAIDGVDAKPYELPEGIVTWYWQVDGVGIVQIHNSFFHAYQLTALTVAK